MSKIFLNMDWFDMNISIQASNNSSFTVNTSQFLSKLETLLQDLSLFENVEVSITTKQTEEYDTYGNTDTFVTDGEDIGDIWLSSKDCEIMGISTNNTMQGDLFDVGGVSNIYFADDEYDNFLLNDGNAWPFPDNYSVNTQPYGNVTISVRH